MSSSTKSENLKTTQQQSGPQAERNRPVSMHEDIPVWHDCCSCEAEPYWLEAMALSADDDSEKQEH